jgi:hypothetical protein
VVGENADKRVPSVVWSFELTAFSMMFLEGYIGAPPTSTVISAVTAGTVP